ncbi:YdaS family helix-turn-helix protein [Moraxella catarrhalis]|uniref:YdaS family helix-turn-helix protein n=1 Tax=Moraxella catarrhalis TaxID=480 RepID=UPI00128DBDC1|nr:YdaS family helix-turn-helix protein [Moraxella catarrhalis]MPW54138.1 hypothetical protein [Moraxella catarrhalis]MPX79052.1 hypothetical protein [Moraxella catarrhalis]
MSYQEKYNALSELFKTQQEMADALGCSQPLVWKMLNGRVFMSAHYALRAEKITEGKFKAVDLCPKLKGLE